MGLVRVLEFPNVFSICYYITFNWKKVKKYFNKFTSMKDNSGLLEFVLRLTVRSD